MNSQSSRSHAIVRLLITSKPAGSELEGRGLVAVLSLVDLAGSETAKKTGATSGARATEGANINKSLFALSRVIEALSQKENAFLKPPFRDSKLTHLLKPALDRGASSMTALVCALHTAAAHSSESASTLQFARRARCVVTRPCVTEELSAKDKARRLAAENDAMRAQLAAKAAAEAEAQRRAEAEQAAAADAQRAEMAAIAERLAFVEQQAAMQASTFAAEAQELRRRIARGNAALVSTEAALAAAVAAGGEGTDTTGAAWGEAAGGLNTVAGLRGGREPGRRATTGGVEDVAGQPQSFSASEEGMQALLSSAAEEMSRLKALLEEERRGKRRAEAAAEALRQEVVMLQGERAAWRAAGEEAAAQCAAAQAAAADAGVEADLARRQATDAAVETEKWRESARKADARWLRAQHDVAATEDRLKISRVECASLRSECDAASSRAAAAEARAARAEAEAMSASEQARSFQAAAQAAEAQAAAAEAQAAAAAARAQALAASVATDSAQQDRTSAQALAEAESRASAAETAADLAAGEVARLRSELASARREAHTATERASAADAEAARARSAAAAAGERASRAETEAQARLGDVAAALDKEANARRMAHDASADASESKAQLAGLQTRLAEVSSALDARTEQLGELQSRVDALEGEMASLRDIEAAAAEVIQQNEVESAEKARLLAQLDMLRAELAAECAARAEAEAQVEQLLEEGVGTGFGDEDAAQTAAQLEALVDEVVALEARAVEAETRAAALAAKLATAIAARGPQSVTPIPSAPVSHIAPHESVAPAQEVPAVVAPSVPVFTVPPPPHRLVNKDHPVAAQRARAQLDAAKAVVAAVADAEAPAAVVAAPPAAPGGKPKCGVCPNPSRARVGAHAHPLFPHIQLCKACLAGRSAAGLNDEEGAEVQAAERDTCVVCARQASDASLCATSGCYGAFCAACVTRHFPEEEAACKAPQWACMLCREECAKRRGPPVVATAFAATEAAAETHGQVDNGRPGEDKENAPTGGNTTTNACGGGLRPAGAKPGAPKRKLGANRALEDDVRY